MKAKMILWLIAQLSSGAADGYLTHRNAVNPAGHFREGDPIARPFVTHGTPELVGYFAFDVGVAVGGAALLDHYKKHHLADVVRAQQVGFNTAGAVVSARGYTR